MSASASCGHPPSYRRHDRHRISFGAMHHAIAATAFCNVTVFLGAAGARSI
jgi:hypothetical protein